MPLFLTFFLSLLAVVGFFGGLWFLIFSLVESKRFAARPRIGIAKGKSSQSLTLWANWNPAQFEVRVFRFKVSFAAPERVLKEGSFTLSYDPPQTAPFSQEVELPQEFLALIKDAPARDALISLEIRTVDKVGFAKQYWVGKLREIMRGEGSAKSTQLPIGLAELAFTKVDPPNVMSLDYEEWVVRKKKLKDLEAAAKAKAAKAPPKPAAAPATPPTPKGPIEAKA